MNRCSVTDGTYLTPFQLAARARTSTHLVSSLGMERTHFYGTRWRM